MRLWHLTPYDFDKQIGASYTRLAALVPRSQSDWVLFVDADCMIALAPDYGHRLRKVIEDNPGECVFTCYTNRVGYTPQVWPEYRGDDMCQHMAIADRLWRENGTRCKDITLSRGWPSGHLMLIRADAWDKVSDLPRGMLGVDNAIYSQLANSGYLINLMEGIYAYHWYRGGDAKNKQHLL